jgi:hypothetical protein
MMVAVRVPDWGLAWVGDARYYGWRWCAHVGPWLVFIRSATPAEMDAFDAELSSPKIET